MGRAIVRDPQVFLFDEPLSNLDAKLRVQMRAEIKELHQRLKTTTVYVTHDQIEAMTMADKIVVMHDGNVEQVGAPLELYDRPANLFVAGFIGSPGHELPQGHASRRRRAAACRGRHARAAAASAAGADGRPAIYGMRPEHLRLPTPTASPRDGAGGRADRLGDAGARAHRRQPVIGAFRERVIGQPGRDHPRRARHRAGPSVRPASRAGIERTEKKP